MFTSAYNSYNTYNTYYTYNQYIPVRVNYLTVR